MREQPRISYTREPSVDVPVKEPNPFNLNPEKTAMDEATRGAIREGTAWPTIEAALEDPQMREALEAAVATMTEEESQAFRDQLKKMGSDLEKVGGEKVSVEKWFELTKKMSGTFAVVMAVMGGLMSSITGDADMPRALLGGAIDGGITGAVAAQLVFAIGESIKTLESKGREKRKDTLRALDARAEGGLA